MLLADWAVAETGGDPDVALAVDGKTAGTESALEILSFARVSSREACDMVDAAVGDPDPILRIDSEMKRRHERLARLHFVAFANDLALSQMPLGEVHAVPR